MLLARRRAHHRRAREKAVESRSERGIIDPGRVEVGVAVTATMNALIEVAERVIGNEVRVPIPGNHHVP